MNDVRLIAFYLPQFHPIDENDQWWGKGFTEWTNVSSSKPVFPGHYQPHIPADLGFYDLRLAESREAQAQLAQEYGIQGFCYYYYYFNGKRLLNKPLDEVLSSGKPDFPFCICWANENWTRRWDGREDDILIEQVHTPESDTEFITQLLPFLRDRRYIRVKNKLLLLVYRTELLPDPRRTAATWREIVKKETGEELYLCAVNFFKKDVDPREIGFDGVVQFPLAFNRESYIDNDLFARLHGLSYEDVKHNQFLNYPSVIHHLVQKEKPAFPYFRGVFPAWDNTPRRPSAGSIFVNSSPELYKLFLKATVGLTMAENDADERLVFVNAWNEWAEGAHLEPDKRHGRRYLEATREALEERSDRASLISEIREKADAWSAYYFTMQQLQRQLKAAEDQLASLKNTITSTRAEFEKSLAERDQQIRGLTIILEQKGKYLIEKDVLIQQKSQYLIDKDKLIRENELFIREQQEKFASASHTMVEQADQLIRYKHLLAEKEGELSQNIQALEESRASFKEMENEIQSRIRELGLLEQTIRLQQEQIAEKNRQISLREQQLSEQDQRLATMALTIRSLEQKIRDKDIQIAANLKKLQNALHLNKVKEITIREKNEFIHELHRSLSWRLTTPVRWAHGATFRLFYLFFPYQSHRWRVLKNLIHRAPPQVPAPPPAPVIAPPQERKEEPKPEPELTAREKSDMEIIASSNLFDEQWYRRAYAHIKYTHLTPLLHFVRSGYKEGRFPNPFFHTSWYRATYPEADAGKINPLVHYIQTGAAKGNDPHPFFGVEYYCKRHPDIRKEGIFPLYHYLRHGSKEKRNLLVPDNHIPLSLQHEHRIAVICHVFYPEIWEELLVYICNITAEFTLFATIPAEHEVELRKRISEDFPTARITVTENKGGDIFPFINALQQIHAEGFDLFCKVHSKKGRTDYGYVWRALLLSSVLGSESTVNSILNAFDQHETMAVAGSRLLYKSSRIHEYANRALTNELYQELYPGAAIPEDWGFFAGTMFWGRTSVFFPLAAMITKKYRFQDVSLEQDGQLAHAIERMFGAVVIQNQLLIGLVDNEMGITHPQRLDIVEHDVPPSAESVEKTMLWFREIYDMAYARRIMPAREEEMKKNGILTDGNASSGGLFRRWFGAGRKPSAVPATPVDSLPGRAKFNSGSFHILLCGHSAGNFLAGGEVSFLDMARSLKDNGFNLTILLPERNDKYIGMLESYAVRFYIIPYRFWGTDRENKSIAVRIARIITAEKIDAVYVNTIMIREPLKAARMRGVPAIAHVRELISGDDVLSKSIRLSKEDIRTQVIDRSDFIIANSKATAEFYQKPGATYVIPNVIDIMGFDIPNHINGDEIRIALISSNIPKKGIYEFIEVARICAEPLPKVRFLLIGHDNETLRSLMGNRTEQGIPDNIEYAGYFEKPVDAVAQAHIIMNLSLFSESFGRTVLEAMAARRPVVAFDFGAISELIEEGKNGFLVPFRDVATAAERIIELCADRSRIIAMGEYGRKIATERYSEQSYDRTMKQVMTEIITQRSEKTNHKTADKTPENSGQSIPVAETSTASRPGLRVSVVIPNYNYAHYLPERIGSILKQTHRPAEILFLDDCSDDQSVEVAKELLGRSGIPFRIIVNETNQGIYRQWLRGISEATGDYLWIAEADDSSHETFLERLLARLVEYGSVMGYSQSERIDEEGKQLAPRNLHHTDDLSKERWLHDFNQPGLREAVDYLFYRNTIPNASACLFKRDVLTDIPEEFTGFRYIGDWFLYSTLLTRGSISYMAEPLNRFRRHSGSVTRVKSQSEEYLAELIRIKRHMTSLFPIHGSQAEKMIHFINKDFKIEGLERNSDHPLAAGFIREMKVRTAGRRRFVFLTTNNGSYYGGSEQLWIETAVKARRDQHDVMIAIKKWDPEPPFFKEFRENGIAILFKEEMDFNTIVDFQPDLMVISTGDSDEGTEYFELCRKHQIPYVIVNQLTKEPKYWPVRQEKVEPVKAGYRNARQVFFTCRNNHRVMEKRLDSKIENAAYHFNPFHFDRNSFVPFPSMDDGLKIAIPANLLRVHKGQHLALEIFNQKKWRERPVFLNLYGKGRDEEIIKEMAAGFGLEKVTFYERTPDLLTIWRDNHAIMLTSFMEGLPIVLVGAMICARVPILTDIGGHREVVEDNREGFIAAEPTVASIEEAMERAYQRRDEWEEIGQKARARILAYLPAGDPVDDFIAKLMPLTGHKH